MLNEVIVFFDFKSCKLKISNFCLIQNYIDALFTGNVDEFGTATSVICKVIDVLKTTHFYG